MCGPLVRYESVDITNYQSQSKMTVLSLPRYHRPVMQLKDGSKGSNGYSALVTLASKSVAIVMQALDRSKLCPLTVDDRLIKELDLLVVATRPKHVCHYLNITLTFLCKITTH